MRKKITLVTIVLALTLLIFQILPHNSNILKIISYILGIIFVIFMYISYFLRIFLINIKKNTCNLLMTIFHIAIFILVICFTLILIKRIILLI